MLTGKMTKRVFWLLLFACVWASLFFGCSSSRLSDQIKFGVFASEKNLWDEAIFRWKKALEANPDSVAAHNNLAVAYEKKGRFQDALKEYETALKLDPDNSRVKLNYTSCQENIQGLKKDEKSGAVKGKDEKK